MSSIAVHNPLIYRNIMTLLEMFKSKQSGNERQWKLPCFCNPQTGEIFDRLSTGLIAMTFSFDMDHRAITWQVEEGKALSSPARAHLLEMADILKKAFPKVERLGQLAHLEWKGPSNDHNHVPEQALLDISREEAERLLLKQPVGTFLFRRDAYAATLQEILRRGLKRSLHCYTLTYLDFDRIVRDRTLVFCNQIWTFYDDDPTLSGPSWNSMADLLKSLGSVVKYQLPTQKSAQR